MRERLREALGSRAVRRSPLLLLFLFLVACGSKPSDPAAPLDVPKLASGSVVESYFPLDHGKLYTYATHEGAENGTLSFRVERTDATHGKWVVVGTNSAKRFVYERDGVAYDGGAYLLKAPLDVGTSWPGEHGGQAKITKTDGTATAADGKTYSSCVVTQEDGTRPPNSRYTTTYCPGVGMVLFEVVTNQGDAKGELKYYGPPIKMESGTSVKIEKSN
jgi:hypothetical protein